MVTLLFLTVYNCLEMGMYLNKKQGQKEWIL